MSQYTIKSYKNLIKTTHKTSVKYSKLKRPHSLLYKYKFPAKPYHNSELLLCSKQRYSRASKTQQNLRRIEPLLKDLPWHVTWHQLKGILTFTLWFRRIPCSANTTQFGFSKQIKIFITEKCNPVSMEKAVSK